MHLVNRMSKIMLLVSLTLLIQFVGKQSNNTLLVPNEDDDLTYADFNFHLQLQSNIRRWSI